MFYPASKAALLLTTLIATSSSSSAQTPNRPYAPADSYLHTTNFLNHTSYLTNLDDQQWYLDNIPFISIPDELMQDVYYYRTSVVKRHQTWIHEGHGWMMTEFIQPVGWAAKYQTIPDSVGHHVLETRWLRDTNVAKDVIELYTRGGVEPLSGISYTHFLHATALEHAYVTGDAGFMVDQLEGMINIYNLWNTTRDNTTGLYHRVPLQDAQEYSLAGYLVGGPGGGPMQEWNDFGLSVEEGGGNDYGLILNGPETYRPNFNAYMTAGARAIAETAALAGDSSLAETWYEYADDLQARMEEQLYSEVLNFWIDRVFGTDMPVEDHQLIGFFPYRFGIGTGDSIIRGLEASLTPEIFLAEFGPTTLSQSNPYYTSYRNASWCCQWNGQSWLYSSSIYLGTLARIARDGLSDIITPDFFFDEMQKYTRTNTRGGVPYTSESHYPDIDEWSADRTNNSENYLHSTYMDNVFTNLFGIIPTLNDTLIMEPLVPENWTHFVIENLPYHGSLLSFVYDRDGSHYGNGTAGLSIYSNGTQFHHQDTLGPVRCQLPFNSTVVAAQLAAQPKWQNILANPNSPWNLPAITSNYCLNQNGDECNFPAWKLNDGKLWYDTVPDNRWTNNQSLIPYGTINITLPRPRKMSSISLAIYEDASHDPNGAIKCPAGISVTTGAGERVAYRANWTSECVPNALNTIPFVRPVPANSTDNTTTHAQVPGGYEVETDFLQVIVSDQDRFSTALSEIQIWTPPNLGPRWEAEDGLMGIFIGGFNGVQSGLNASVVDGGVELTRGGWVELAGVRRDDGGAGRSEVALLGGGNGTVNVMANYIGGGTNVTFDGGRVDRTIEVDFLRGGNVLTMMQMEGEPWIDAVVVGS